jgi:hypothetical protein
MWSLENGFGLTAFGSGPGHGFWLTAFGSWLLFKALWALGFRLGFCVPPSCLTGMPCGTSSASGPLSFVVATCTSMPWRDKLRVKLAGSASERAYRGDHVENPGDGQWLPGISAGRGAGCTVSVVGVGSVRLQPDPAGAVRLQPTRIEASVSGNGARAQLLRTSSGRCMRRDRPV